MDIQSKTEIAKREAYESFPGIRVTALVGSSFISCKNTSDLDLLVLLPEFPSTIDDAWTTSGQGYGENGDFISLKKYIDGFTINLLFVTSPEYFDKWVAAANACKFIHEMGFHLDTSTVHGVHSIFMDGFTADLELRVRGL